MSKLNGEPEMSEMTTARNLIRPEKTTYVRFLLTISIIIAAALVALAVYNVSLWQDDKIPKNSHSRLVLYLQSAAVLFLLLTAFAQAIAVFEELFRKNWRNSALCLTGATISMSAILFTINYDHGSVFYQ